MSNEAEQQRAVGRASEGARHSKAEAATTAESVKQTFEATTAPPLRAGAAQPHKRLGLHP